MAIAEVSASAIIFKGDDTLNQNEANKIIEEGLAEIDKENATDKEIRQRGQLLADQLKLNKSIRVVGFEDNSNWQLGSMVFDWTDKTTGQKRSCVRLICANEERMNIMGIQYSPMVIDAEIDKDFDYEQALLAATTAFVAKMFGKFIVEQLD